MDASHPVVRKEAGVGLGEARSFSFVGVSTRDSAIMRVFPAWTAYLGLQGVKIRGYDLPIHAPRQRYRQLVHQIRSGGLELGGLVTTHKLDLFAACQDMFDYLDPYAQLCREVSCLSKKNGQLRGSAKDPVVAGSSLEALAPQGYWAETGAEALLIGAGGANIAIWIHLLTARAAEDRPVRITVSDRDPQRLNLMRELHERLGKGSVETVYQLSQDRSTNSLLMRGLTRGSLVVNGTGMGKDLPGSPLADDASFPRDGLVWELNYRGELDFLRQAEKQRAALNLVIEDGWRYFVRAWTATIEEVLEIKISAEEFKMLDGIARSLR